jgi:DNA processing protein
MDNLYLAALLMTPNLGSARVKSLLERFGSAKEIWHANQNDLSTSGCLDATTCNNLLFHREKIQIHALADKWAEQAIKICSIYDADYPELLRHIVNPPLILYYRGNLPATNKIIAMVGSRHASAYGKNIAQMMADELTNAGFAVVSGAARGIDTAAHLGALSQGSTFAVLGCGVDVCYPPENAKMLRQIADQGAVITEYSPGTPPHPMHFPARNRIISGLARGVIVVEAAAKSGALITADFALEQGRDVFAVPGSIFSTNSKGTHKLIKQGAKLVENVNDILEEYGAESPMRQQESQKKLDNDCI